MNAIPVGKFHLSLLLSISLLSLACSGGAGGGREGLGNTPFATPPTVRDSAGVTIVENAEPQWTPGSEWRVGELVTSIGEAQGDPAYELYAVLDATRQSDGTVAVGNSSSGEIRFFDSNGTFLRQVGSKGGGPGEFRGAYAIRALRRVAGDTLIAWDIYGQLVSVFGPTGEFVRSFSLRGPAQQHFFGGVFEDQSLLMYVFEYVRDEPVENLQEGLVRTPMSLHRYGVDHGLVSSIGDISDSDKFQARWGPSGMMSTEAPFGRVTSISAGGNRTYVSTGDSDQVLVYGQSGALELVIRRTLDSIQVTPEMIRRDRARRNGEEREHLEESQVEPRVLRMIEALPYPEFLPPYGRTMLDSEGNLWLEEFRITSDDPAVWSVFDPDGVWLGAVTLPPGLRIFEIGADYILAKTLDEMEVERVVVYRLLKNSDR